jgi:hypothetical protein
MKIDYNEEILNHNLNGLGVIENPYPQKTKWSLLQLHHLIHIF